MSATCKRKLVKNTSFSKLTHSVGNSQYVGNGTNIFIFYQDLVSAGSVWNGFNICAPSCRVKIKYWNPHVDWNVEPC